MSNPVPKTLYAEFTARPEHEEYVQRLVQQLTRDVRAEPGNILFLPFTLADNPRRYLVLETYVDDAAFAEHLASEHSMVFNAALRPLIEEEGSQLTWLRDAQPN